MAITTYEELSANGKIVYSAYKREKYTAIQVNGLVPAKITAAEATFIINGA